MSKIEIDTNLDTFPDFFESYFENGGKLTQWDTDFNSVIDVSYKKHSLEKNKPLIEEHGYEKIDKSKNIYYNFYVFKYATGLSAAMKFAANILSGDPVLREKYYSFLKAGDSRPVLDILRDSGVDFINEPVVDDALIKFGELVGQLKKVL